MPPSEPRNAVYKDSVVAYLALKAQFAIADNHPKEHNILEPGKLMLLYVPYPIPPETEPWKGEYYFACKLFLQENAAEIAEAGLDVEQLLRMPTAIYWSGENLWEKANAAKRDMLDEFHVIFCQEVNPSWPILPSGKLISDLMDDLRKVLFTKNSA